MAKKKEEEKQEPTIAKVEKAVLPSTDNVDVSALPTNSSIRDDRRDAVNEQKNLIKAEKANEEVNQANIDQARQNIKTLRQNASAEINNNRIARQKDYANQAVDSVVKWMEDTGYQNEDGSYKDLDEESIASALPSKQLWYFQKFNNKDANWGTALGGRAIAGNVNDTTVAMLNKMAKERIAAKKQAEASKYDVKDEVIYGDGRVGVSNRMRDEMKQWGNQITDANDISPEQVTQLYQKLEGYGVSVPKKTITTKDANGADVTQEVYDIPEDGASIYEVIEGLGDDADAVMEELGFGGVGSPIVIPHDKTFDEMMAEREAKREELKLLNQQKALERAKLRTGLADLAAGIGDMIKASNGAIVNPRDYDKKYAELTAQQQINYNNYLARMEAKKQELKAKQKEAADRAYQEKLLKDQYAREDALLKAAQEREDAQRVQDHAWKMEEIHARGLYQLNIQKEKNKAKLEKFNSKRIINFDGVNYTYPEGAKNSVISQLLPIVKPYFNDANGYKSMLSGIQNSDMQEYGKGEEIANLVICAISDPYLYLSDDDKSAIVNVLNGLASGSHGGTTGGGTQAQSVDSSASKTKKYKAPNGTIITQEQFNRLSQVQKDKCEPVE